MVKEEIFQMAKPILFNTDMVRAILDDRKSETRRLIKPRYRDDEYGFRVVTNKVTGARYIKKTDENEMGFDSPRYINPPYQAGDYLYVRETWCNANKEGVKPDYCYYADTFMCEDYDRTEWKWRPSIHMPKEAARLFLRVTDVRVERLQDITEEQAEKEGCGVYLTENKFRVSPVCHFMETWDSTIQKEKLDKYGWDANPWVWVIEFERCGKPQEGAQNDH